MVAYSKDALGILMRIEYFCDGCGDERLNHTMKSFVCNCGGTFRTRIHGGFSVFKPYHCLASNRIITSAKEEAAINKKEGVRNLGDCTDMRKKMADIRKNKEDIIADRYAKTLNVKYPKGKKVRFDDVHNRFIPVTAK